MRGFINYQELGGKEPRSLAFKAREADKNSQEFSPATSRWVHITGLATYQIMNLISSPNGFPCRSGQVSSWAGGWIFPFSILCLFPLPAE